MLFERWIELQKTLLMNRIEKLSPQIIKLQMYYSSFDFFFKIDNENKLIFFTWMNDEKCLHVSGGKNDCYKVFRSLYKKGEIEEYTHHQGVQKAGKLYLSTPDGKRDIEILGNDEQIYAKYESEFGVATSFMLQKNDEQSYHICFIDPMEENHSPTFELLSKVCEKADQSSINLEFAIFIESNETSRVFIEKLLSTNGFELRKEIDEAFEFVRIHK